MANLGVDRTELNSIVAHFLGFPFDSTQWTTEESVRLRQVLDSSIRNVHYPRPTVLFPHGHRFTWTRPWTTFIVWPTVPASAVTAAGVFGTVTTITATAASFYPSMVGREIVVTTVGTFPIASYVSATVITIASNNPFSAKTFSVAATGDYRLPSTFGGLDGPITFDGVFGFRPIDVVGEDRVRIARQGAAATGVPEEGAVLAVAFTGLTEQLWDLALYPTPGALYTLKFPYHLLPNALSTTEIYPPGGPPYAELVIESCMAAAEKRFAGLGNEHQVEFERLINVAIQYDLDAVGPEKIGYNSCPSSGRWNDRQSTRHGHATPEALIRYNGYPA